MIFQKIWQYLELWKKITFLITLSLLFLTFLFPRYMFIILAILFYVFIPFVCFLFVLLIFILIRNKKRHDSKFKDKLIILISTISGTLLMPVLFFGVIFLGDQICNGNRNPGCLASIVNIYNTFLVPFIKFEKLGHTGSALIIFLPVWGAIIGSFIAFLIIFYKAATGSYNNHSRKEIKK